MCWRGVKHRAGSVFPLFIFSPTNEAMQIFEPIAGLFENVKAAAEKCKGHRPALEASWLAILKAAIRLNSSLNKTLKPHQKQD